MTARLLKLTFLFFLTATLFSSVSAQEKDRIQFATINANYRVALEELVAEYERLNPHIQVDLSIVTLNFETWIRTRMAAGGDMVPDIYNANFTTGYDQLGKWIPLDDALNSVNPYTGKIWSETLDMQLVEKYRYTENIYQLPVDKIEIAVFYNKDIFEKVGVEVPENWTEFLEVCQKIKDADYAPIAISGNANSFWAGDMGWLVRIFSDAYLRRHLPDIMAQPGDWNYEEDRNGNYVYDGDDLYADLLVVPNTERLIQAVLDGTIDPRSPAFKQVYVRLKEMAGYFQEGYFGSDMGMAQQLFYRQGAAMIFFTSANVTAIIDDFKDLDPEDRFRYGNFWLPSIENDPLVCGPFRGVGGAGMSLAAMKQGSPEHQKNVIDFLMFLTSPQSGEILIKRTLEDNQPIIGPLAIKGVKLPEEIADKFDVFKGRGYEKLSFRGLEDEQEGVFEWSVLAQEYMAGRLPLDDFAEEYATVLKDSARRLIKQRGLDMDPSTKDPPPVYDRAPNPWNPFENGSLMLILLVLLFASFAVFHIWHSQGARRRTTIVAYILLFPTFFLLGTFAYFPALSGLYHAFTQWEEGQAAVFNGLDNFRAMLNDKVLFQGIWNMLALLLTGLFKATVIPFIGAEMILFLMSNRLRYMFRTLFMIPMVVPGMVTLLIWSFIFEPNMGLLNQVLTVIGLEGWTQSWLGEPHLALPSIIFMGFPWIGGPGMIGLLIFMAGLMNIPSSVYESFHLESESVLRRIWFIDLPLVRNQFRLLIILTFIGAVQDFQTILILTDGGPGLATTVPALRMYHQAFRFTHYGYGAAIGLILFIVILSSTMLIMRMFKKMEVE